MNDSHFPRLYTNQPLTQHAMVNLSAAQAHYLHHVLRLRCQDGLLLFNGMDGQWQAEITEISKRSLSARLLEQTRPQHASPDIWLCFAPVKNSKIDSIVRKATELGVSAIQPVITRRTIVTKVREDKMLANAIEAAEQCERLTIPAILPAQPLPALLHSWEAKRTIMFCDESGDHSRPVAEALSQHPKDTPPHWAVFIGPEGGFTPEEQALLKQQSRAVAVGLGPRILRADTAAFAALACWQSLLGDWHEAPRFAAPE